MYVKSIPVSRNVGVIDVPTDNLVRAEGRPPHHLSSPSKGDSNRFRDRWGTRWRGARHGGDKIQQRVVGVVCRTRKVKRLTSSGDCEEIR